VIVPGLGALIAHHTSASFDAELGCVFPPRRSIVFNAELTHNDGLLVSSVARRHRISYEQAVQVVADEVTAMRCQLRQDGETGIGHLGVLSLTAEGVLSFMPYESASVSPQYVGLSAVKAVPLAANQERRAAVPVVCEEQPEDLEYTNIYTPIHRGLLHVAAMVVALVVLGLMLSTPIIDDNAMRASMVPAIERASAATSNVDELQALDSRTKNISLIIAMPDADSAVATVDADSMQRRQALRDIRCDASDRYFLIVASLPSEKKAMEYIASHPTGDEMHLLETDGKYRVYVATGNTLEATQRAMTIAGFSARYPQAWVCRR
jgi:hypothetical protein